MRDAIRWIDSHCHLDFPAFETNLDAVLARAREAGVTDFVVPAVTAAGWSDLLALQVRPGVHAALGLHPWWTAKHRAGHMEVLRGHLAAGAAVAIGECGLDYARDVDPELQLRWFREQLRLAADFALPVIVHAVRALDAALAEVRAFPGMRGVIHGFAGSRPQAERCLEMGLMLGIGPAVVRSARLREIVRMVPAACLLLETDAPDRAMAGGRGEPVDVVAVGEAVAGIKQVAPDVLAGITSANARRLFAWERP